MSQNQPTAATPAAAAQQQQPMGQQRPMGNKPFTLQSGQIQENMLIQMAQATQQQRHQGHPDGQRSREPRERRPSVYVGNLPKDYYQLDLFKYVKGLNYNIASATIGTDKNTKRQNRYGFLSFYHIDEARRCANELNNTKIKGSEIRCNVQEANFNDPKSNVYVKNIDAAVTQQQLHNAFTQFGEIISCKLETYTDGTSRGFGYIQFKSTESAEAAIQKGGIDISGKKVDVLAHQRKEQRKGTEQKCLNIFVQGLPKGSDDEWLKSQFKAFGEISSAHVQRADSDDSLQNKGYVSFKEAESAEKAIDEMNKKSIGDTYLLVGPHISQRESQVATSQGTTGNPIQKQIRQTFQSNLFVKNVPSEITDTELCDTFTQCGPVISVKMRQGKHFNSKAAYRQYFVLYKEVDDAKKAIQKFDQSTPFGTRPLSVQFWMPSSELHQEREARSQHEVQQYFFKSLYGQMSYGAGGQMRGDGQGQYNPMQGGARMPRNDAGKPNNRGNQMKGGNRGGMRNNAGPRGPRQDFTQGQQVNQSAGMANGQMLSPEQQQMMYQQQQMQMQQQQQQQMSQPLVSMDIFEPSVDPNTRKQAIGNAIYPIIFQRYGELANKITGMLLDNEKVVDQQALVTNLAYMQQKATEAYDLLARSQQAPMEGEATQQ